MADGALPGTAMMSPAEAAGWLQQVRAEMGRVIVGQTVLVDRLLIALLCDGHCLLEGVPGLAKSLTISTLARCLRADFVRVQFTPDLLPADLVGTEVYDAGSGAFQIRRGPIFANIVLADEINRAPAKVQSALLEAMQERHVSIGGYTFDLPAPFMVLATQNPIEQEGTYPLPEAQLDRFLFKIRVDYPAAADERVILDRHLSGALATVRPVLDQALILAARGALDSVTVADALRDYVVRLVRATRGGPGAPPETHWAAYGASPRATIALAQAARALALLREQSHVTPDDVKAVAPDVLRHRVLVTYEAEAEGVTADTVIAALLDAVPLV